MRLPYIEAPLCRRTNTGSVLIDSLTSAHDAFPRLERAAAAARAARSRSTRFTSATASSRGTLELAGYTPSVEAFVVEARQPWRAPRHRRLGRLLPLRQVGPERLRELDVEVPLEMSRGGETIATLSAMTIGRAPNASSALAPSSPDITPACEISSTPSSSGTGTYLPPDHVSRAADLLVRVPELPRRAQTSPVRRQRRPARRRRRHTPPRPPRLARSIRHHHALHGDRTIASCAKRGASAC